MARTRQRRVRARRAFGAALLVALGTILYLYIDSGLTLLSALSERSRAAAQVRQLARRYGALAAERRLLESTNWLETEARRLGFGFPGERQYVPGEPEGG